MYTGAIRFEFGFARPPEDVRFSVEERDLLMLRSYLREAEVLQDLRRRLSGSVGFSMSVKQGEAVRWGSREIGPTERAALLHHLRPFLLQNEPFSFHKARNVVARALEGDFIKGWLQQVKVVFSGQRLAGQVKLLSRDVLVNSDATLQLWLNASEYHRDPDKADRLERIIANLPKEMTHPLFLMLLIEKADAVLYLGHAVHKVVEGIDRPA